MLEELRQLYEVARDLDADTLLRLILQAESQEERSFWTFLLNTNLQRGQKAAIEQHRF